jgi:hypothetical protein
MRHHKNDAEMSGTLTPGQMLIHVEDDNFRCFNLKVAHAVVLDLDVI